MNVATFAGGALVLLGIIITVLGLFVGGSIQLAVIGLVAIAAGGGIGLFAQRRLA